LIFSKLKGIQRNVSEKKTTYDRSIQSPELGLKEFYTKTQGNHGKLDFMSFIKSIEMICFKLYPEISMEISLKHLWNNHISVLLKTLEKNKINERAIGSNRIEALADLLKNKDIVNKK